MKMKTFFSLLVLTLLLTTGDGGEVKVCSSGDSVDDGPGQIHAQSWPWPPINFLPSSLAFGVKADSFGNQGLSSIGLAAGSVVSDWISEEDFKSGKFGLIVFVLVPGFECRGKVDCVRSFGFALAEKELRDGGAVVMGGGSSLFGAGSKALLTGCCGFDNFSSWKRLKAIWVTGWLVSSPVNWLVGGKAFVEAVRATGAGLCGCGCLLGFLGVGPLIVSGLWSWVSPCPE